jgi:YgiT-type zinc finger domain-containing protein
MDTEDNKSKQFCNHCHIGSLEPHRATYTQWHDGQFIILPNVPARRCDFCGEVFFDNDAMIRLILLLGSGSDLENDRRWRTTGLDDGRDADLGDPRRVG